MRRRFFVSIIVTVGLILLTSYARPARRQNRAARPTARQAARLALRITLGSGDREARDWSGKLAPSAGRVVRLEGWQFALDDRIEGSTWQAASKKPVVSRANNPATPPLVEPLGILPVGVEAVVEAPEAARLDVETRQGNFAVALDALRYGSPLEFLEGAARVERQPVSESLGSAELEDDQPSIAVTRDGTVWVAWIGYRNQSDEIFARPFREGAWSAPVRVSPRPGDYFRVGLAEDAGGRLWAVWSAQEDGNWDLRARALERGTWGPVSRLTDNPAPDIFPSLAAGKDGRLALAWMSFRAGQSDVYLKTWDGSRWSPEVRISESRASDWEPSVAVDSKGTAWVAWDSYDRGSYNILLRSVAGEQVGEIVRVTDSPRYHARASVAVDALDRPWVAWEESEANWGKDYGYLATATPWRGAGNPLYRSRSVTVAVLDSKSLMTTERPLMNAVPAALRTYLQLPELRGDSQGRIWALLRARSFVRTESADVWAAGGRWNTFLTVYSGGDWAPLVPFGDSVGPNYSRASAATGPDGKIWTAWATDGRSFGNPPAPPASAANLTPHALSGFGAVPGNYDVRAAALAAADFGPRGGRTGRDLVPLRPDLASSVPVHPDEDGAVGRIRGYELRSGGKTYHIYRGDMHRHTDISADGAGDGSVMDLFRYAIDAARMDYAMVTDHNSGFDQEYSWWRIEKTDDLFQVPGAFTTLFGYERSLNYPNGHRNVAFAARGVRTLPVAPGEQAVREEVKVNSGAVLYPYLRKNRGIAFSHTSHTGMGTDWRDNDPELEPLVEIYQGMRTSADRPETHQGGYKPAGYVSNAWAKGYRLGVQASSDHISTHISYSCVISEDRSREGLMNAMRRRHCYGATDNIILDVRMADGAAEYIQGDAFNAAARPRLLVRVIGTRPIAEVTVVKNNRSAFTRNPKSGEVDFVYTDTDAEPGTSFYYVRVAQEDGQVAWSSPVWVTYPGRP